MKTFTYVIQDPLGIHARPAGMIAQKAMSFQCDITLQTPTASADAKRIMAVMRLVAKQGTPITVTCQGEDESAAATQLEKLFQESL